MSKIHTRRRPQFAVITIAAALAAFSGPAAHAISWQGDGDWSGSWDTTVGFGAGWRVGVEATASATHRVVPAWSAGLQLQRAVGAGFVASATARWSRYEAAATATGTGLGSLGVERYWGTQRLAWTGYLSTLAGTWSGSQRLAWDLFLREGDRLGVAIAAGRELEGVGGGEVRGAQVVAAALTGRHAVAGGWSLSWELGVQRQGVLYVRTGGRVGLRRDF